MQPGVILYFFIQGEADEVVKQRGVPFVLEILPEYPGVHIVLSAHGY